MNRTKATGGWRLNVALTAGIMTTVLVALIMAQLDALQTMPPEHGRLVIANIQATAVSNGSPIPLLFGSNTDTTVPADPAAVVPDVNPRASNAPAGALDFPVCGEVPAGWLLYTVVSGDTVAGLAAATQTDAAAILAANCMTADTLSDGMQILLPSDPAAAPPCGPPQWWVRYQVRAGDSMTGLALSRNTTVAEVLRANCRDSEELSVGQFIFLPPGGQLPPAPPVAQPPVVPPPVVEPPTATPVPPSPEATATFPPPPPVEPSATSIPPTFAPPVPTREVPTATVPPPPTATVPPPPPTATVPPPPPPTDTPPPPPPTREVPTATVPPPPPTATIPPPPPTDTPPPPPPTSTPVPEPTSPAPEPTQTWYRVSVWWRYWR